MEIVVYPRAFNVTPTISPTIQGGEQQTMTVIVQDVGGDVLKVVFGLADWAAFQQFVANPEEAAERAKARAKIVGPGGLAATLKERKH